jgi:phage terminase large subunit-like protein
MPTARVKRKPTRKAYRGVDAETKNWIRNASDELAAKNGCRFDIARATFAREWIEGYCRLYEGEFAGQPMILSDWQLDAVMNLFGWVRHSDDWGREVRRFRRGGVWVPKKNAKSPTLAGIGLYLLCGDGEQGQKVYSSAKDGKQAMISHTHALEMVKRSPELLSECKINKSTGQITHEPTRSFYRVVAGDNPDSQEGLNGSVMVDETHVVDRNLMRILKRAGISRAEPIQLEFSSAGKNPDGYGKSQWDYGREVVAGNISDEAFFYRDYSAPQDAADEDIDTNVIEYGKRANPAWGRIVKHEEFLADYQTSRRSRHEFADFKMYRLGIWQRSSSPFLKESDWTRCKQSFTESDMLGKKCWAGLDLSKTRDMSSLGLVFPWADGIRILSFFWMPESAARENAHLAPFMQWADAGHLILTPGDVTDYGFIRSTFRRLAGLFKMQQLAYDQTYAEETTQALEQGVRDESGKVIEEGTGVPRAVFEQKMMAFAPVCAEFERLVISGKLWHNGHPVLTWQAGHVQVKKDYNNNMRPVKPGKDDIRKVDGIVAAMEALGAYMLAPRDPPQSIYETRGLVNVNDKATH